MCGISGVFNYGTGEPADEKRLRAMCAIMAHRGPDGEGVWTEGEVGLGHRRLSIIDLSTGGQPMANEDGAVWIAFNGEIYNYRGLARDLAAKGHVFKTRSDTETLIHLYEEKGEDFLADIRGMFALGLWDGRTKKLLLARDRLGKKPLYFHDDGKRVVFASEIKALLTDPAIGRELSGEALSDYLSFLYIPGPRTIFKGIRKLEPGTYAVFASDGCKIKRYWDVEFKERPDLTPGACRDELMALLEDSVKCRLESEVPLGAFLSGGIDSSAVVGLMSRLMDRPVDTTSIGFREESFNELAYSRKVAGLFHTNHHEHILEADFIARLPTIVWHLDEPFADSSALPTYLLCQMVRKSVTVALSGDGGDETFAGYDRYRSTRFEDRLRAAPAWLRRSLLSPLLQVIPPLTRGRSLVANLSLPFEAAVANTLFFFDRGMKQELLVQPVPGYDSYSVLEAHLRNCASADPVSRLQYLDFKTYLPEDILMKVDKMSMAHSLEVRAPLLDHRLVELVAGMPSAWKQRDGAGKYILKQTLAGLLPHEILHRRKSGFSVPLDTWGRGPLGSVLERVLFDRRTQERGIFSPRALRKLWNSYQAPSPLKISLGSHIWALVVFELWTRLYLDGDDPAAMALA